MAKRVKISEAEMEVMRVIWSLGAWTSVADVCKALEERNWNYKTIGTFLLRLHDKGALEAKKEGKANYYRAAITEAEYKQAETEEFLQEVHGGSMKSLLAALCDGAADAESLDRLEQWLKER